MKLHKLLEGSSVAASGAPDQRQFLASCNSRLVCVGNHDDTVLAECISKANGMPRWGSLFCAVYACFVNVLVVRVSRCIDAGFDVQLSGMPRL